MISNKVYLANGINNRFLSDFIIRSENYARPYVFIYDETLDPQGSEDILQSPLLPWSYPSNLYRRGNNIAKSEDLVTTDKWQVVDNSILYYTAPPSGATVWVEVATTSEEFGATLIAPSVERAETAATNALVSEGAAKASELLADADATQTAIDKIATNNDVVLTHADVVLTHADVVLTGLDVDTTNANVLLTNADVELTNADAIQTALDKIATNADVVATNADVVATNADVVLTHADVDTSSAQALIINAYGNIEWAGFSTVDSELIVSYFDSATSVPSIVDGDFIITY